MASGRPYRLRGVRSRRHARGTGTRPPCENGKHPRHRRLAVSHRSLHRCRLGNTVGRRRGAILARAARRDAPPLIPV
ncbi:hypothetical protein WT53_20990 [Burkholderia sp. MSMB2157WGS]|nr:hypothetical protein WT53_20990 [Burkholderia sp. MSMB2157WGS]